MRHGSAILALLLAALAGVVGSANAALLYPNLKTLAPRDLRFDRTDVTAESLGVLHNVLRFSNTVYNAGEGPVVIRAKINQSLNPPSGQAFQRVYETGGGYKEFELTGATIYYHAVHKHYHFDHWGAYQLWTKAGYESWLASGRTKGEPYLIGQKTTSCVEDEEFVTSVPAAVWPAVYVPEDCGTNAENVIAEGLSPGWGDTYDWYRFEQWIDLGEKGSLANGSYVLRSVADPDNIVYESPEKATVSRESAEDNEASTAFKVTNGTIEDGDQPTGTITINHVDTSTGSPQVTLEALGRDDLNAVDQVRISNDGKTWKTYTNTSYDSVAQTIPWNLTDPAYGGSETAGMHTVYAQFHDPSAGWGPTAQDTIEYAPSQQPPPPPPGAAYGKTVEADAPVSWWRLGESAGTVAADKTGTNPGAYLSGTTLGAASLVATESSNTAVAFDGAKGAVKVASSSSLNLSSPFSLEAWIKPSKLPTAGSFSSVLTKAESYSLQFNGPNLEFTVIQSGTRHRLQAPSGTIVAGNVYHVVGTYDGTTQRLYVNGAQVASAALSGPASVTANSLYLGSWAGGEEFLTGVIDEAAVYNKALSAARIAEHYAAATKASLQPPSGLSAGASSSTEIDLSWSDNTAGETGETLQRSADSAFSAPVSIALAAGTHAYSDTGLTPGTTYWYRVKSNAGGSSSPYSNTAQASTPALATYRSTVLADRPLSYWRLDETGGTIAGDQTVANPGTFVSTTLGAPGLIPSDPTNGAVAFNGTNGDVRIGQSGALDFTTAMTLEAWISPTSLPPAGSSRSILAKPGSYALQLNGSALAFTVLEFGVRNTVSTPQGSVVPGGVYHVVGTYDGVNERLYVNGAQVALAPLAGSPEQSLGGMHIGSWDGASEFCAGTIDEAAVYPAVLSPERIAAHFNISGASAKPPPPAGGAYAKALSEDAPVSWWRLGESSGTAAADQSAVNPGVYANGTTLGASSLLPGEPANTAVALDGVKGAVKVASSTSLNLTSPFSLEAWIKPSKLPAAGSFASVLSKAESYSLQFNGPRLEFTVIQSGTRHRLQAPSGAIVAGSTYYVVGTYDGTTQRLYINGAQVASVTLSGPASVTANSLYLGSWAGGEEFLTGVIDEAAVYNKALTAAQITKHYTAATS